MTSQNPHTEPGYLQTWIRAAFDFHRTKTLRKVSGVVILAGMYFYTIEWLEENYYTIEFYINSYIFYFLGYVLVMFFYFRIGTAYYRWWDGRKFVSYLSSNAKVYAMKVSSFLDDDHEADKKFLNLMIINHGYALKGHLRMEINFKELEEAEESVIVKLKKYQNVPSAILELSQNRITELYKKSFITSIQMLELNKHIDKAVELQGFCEKIKLTAAPFSYRMHLKAFLYIFTFLLPFGFVHKYEWWIVPILMGVFYFYAGIEVISEEIEDPFGLDEHDLPMDEIMYSMKNNVKAIAGYPETHH